VAAERIQANSVAVAGTHAPLLLATSVTALTGEVTLVAGDPGYGQIALALTLSGQRARGADVTAFLLAMDGGHHARQRWEQLPTALRTQWLTELASRRAEVDFLVLASPDRFGGDPRDWWNVAKALADKGKGVIVQCTHASARLLSEPVRYELGVS
jgi:hypothetical protein